MTLLTVVQIQLQLWLWVPEVSLVGMHTVRAEKCFDSL